MFRFAIAILLGLTIIFSSAGWVLLAVFLRTVAKYEAHLSKEHRVVIELKFSGKNSDPDVQWEHSREFSYGGWMFDVEEIRDSAGVRIVRAHRDDFETEVVNTTRNVAEKETSGAAARATETLKMFSWNYQLSIRRLFFPSVSAAACAADPFNAYHVSIAVETPPPKVMA